MMDPILQKLLSSLVLLLVLGGVHFALMRGIRKSMARESLRRHRAVFVGKVLRVVLLGTGGLLLIGIWGFSMETIWIFMSGLLGLIAIGFVAVWSLLSNIVAGVLLFFTNPFRIGERVSFVGEEMTGEVEDITLMFVTLRDGEDLLRVPNNLFFQRALRIRAAA
ncbi:MAG: mechanosensitive ion channel [Verrucomicrobia bacterium]|jgi:small-conductance mechanosensitive channel|nr:mechanosensitive ion channel [Verrucomicrobiota bacterium]